MPASGKMQRLFAPSRVALDFASNYGKTVFMQSGDFEWDDDKAAANVAKHGISFEVARRIFDDPHWCELAIDTHAGETRFNNLDTVNGAVLHVATAEGDGGRDRIISARKATRNEQREYERQASD